MRRYRYALLGYYGFGNLGDELLLQACIDILTRKGVAHSQIIVLSNSPDSTARDFSVDSVNRWRFRDVVSALRHSDTLLLGGGGLFQDSTSVKSCVWYWGIVRLARLLETRVAAWGQSVGPLSSGLSRWMALDALGACESVNVRDEASLVIARESRCPDVTLGTDLVMSLKPESYTRCENGYMLVNLRPSSKLDDYVRLIAPHLKDERVIGAALSDDDVEPLTRIMPAGNIRSVRSFRDAQELWQGASSSLGMRLHFGVLSRIFRVPLAMMPYDVKVSEFARQSGVPCISDAYREPVMPLEVPESPYDRI